MTYSLNDIKNLLRLISAFATLKQTAFDYNGKLRIVEPHAVGTSTKDGSLLLRAYQIAGESASNEPSGWRMFTISKIDNVRVLDTASQAPRPGYAEGDSQMGELLAQIVSR